MIQFGALRLLLDVYEAHGLRASINAEVLEQLAHRREAAHNASFGQLADEWEEAVGDVYRRGHDVGLHIHPQWSDASFDGGWKLRGSWQLTCDRPPGFGPFLLMVRTGPRLLSVVDLVDARARLDWSSFAEGSCSHFGSLLQLAANAAGVNIPRPRWGRSVLYSTTQSLITTRASSRLSNSSPLRTSSRIVPLKRSTNAFCCGLPFSMNAVCTPWPASQSPRLCGDELAAVVGAQQLRPAVPFEQLLELADHIAGADRAGDPAADSDPGVLVDDVEDPHRQPVSCPAAHEVVRPDVVGPRRRQVPDRLLRRRPAPFARAAAAPGRHPVALQPPQPLDPLAVDLPPLRPQKRPDPPIALARMLGRELVHPRRPAAARTQPAAAHSVASSDAARPAGTPDAPTPAAAAPGSDGGPATRRAHHFPRCRSFNIEMSNACSATIFFNRAFSCSSAFNRCASSSFNAPYLIRHR